MSRSAADHRNDLLLQGGHVIDARNDLSAVRDVAILDGRIAVVAEKAGLPVMVDFGDDFPERPLATPTTR